MSVQPNDFLASAERLSKSNDEMDLRNILSRSYYAAYHKALKFADSQSLPDPKNAESNSDHLKLRQRIEQAGMKASPRLALLLNNTRKMRVDADYYLRNHISTSDAATQLAYVNDIFKKIDWIEGDPSRATQAVVQPEASPPSIKVRPQLRVLR